MIPVSFNAANGNKTRSPSSSGGRAGVSISNPPPRLLLVCMVVYIGGESTMQISLSSILTVYYDDQLCVGLAERAEEGRYNAARKRWRSVSSSESRSASRSTVGIDQEHHPVYGSGCGLY